MFWFYVCANLYRSRAQHAEVINKTAGQEIGNCVNRRYKINESRYYDRLHPSRRTFCKRTFYKQTFYRRTVFSWTLFRQTSVSPTKVQH